MLESLFYKVAGWRPITFTAQKMKFSGKDFSETLNGKLLFLCSAYLEETLGQVFPYLYRENIKKTI